MQKLKPTIKLFPQNISLKPLAKSNGEVYVFGGRSPTGRSDQLVKLTLKSSEWEEEKPGGFPPAARSFGASVNLTSDSFLVFDTGIDILLSTSNFGLVSNFVP